jgi:hypothetical protein
MTKDEYVRPKYAISQKTRRNRNYCGKCGREHRRNEKYPAEGKKCNQCFKMNDFAAMYKTKPHKSRNPKKKMHTTESDSSSDDEFYVGSIDTPIHSLDNMWYETLEISNHPIRCQFDTGAKCNVMSTKIFSQLKLDVITTKPNTSLKSYSVHSITLKYVVKIPCMFKTSTYDIQFYIVDIDATPVLGAKTCSDLGPVKRMYSIQSNENDLFENNQTYEIPADIQKNYADVSKGIGCILGEHSIKIDSTVQPVVHVPHKIPIAIKDKVKEELERVEKKYIIVKQTEPTPWVNSMVTVIKPSNKVHICMDPQDLNKARQGEHFPLKAIEEVIADMPQAKVFSKIDAKSRDYKVYC